MIMIDQYQERVVEECGIPREAFGMKKQGAGFSYSYD